MRPDCRTGTDGAYELPRLRRGKVGISQGPEEVAGSSDPAGSRKGQERKKTCGVSYRTSIPSVKKNVAGTTVPEAPD